MKDVEISKSNDSINKHDFENVHFHLTPRNPQSNGDLFVDFNRLLYSRKCIYVYVFLIFSSITIFVYSIIAYFFNWNELPILICESLLIIVITVDVSIRVYVTVYFLYKLS
jgi:hypothetical protein